MHFVEDICVYAVLILANILDILSILPCLLTHFWSHCCYTYFNAVLQMM